MNPLTAIRYFNAIPPGVIKDNAAFVANVLDKQTEVPNDAKAVQFVVSLGATDIAMDTLKVMESDTKTDGTTLGGVPVLVKDTAAKPADDDDNGIAVITVPLSKWTKRFLQLQATAGNGAAGTYLSALAVILAPGVSGPDAADMNAISHDVA